MQLLALGHDHAPSFVMMPLFATELRFKSQFRVFTPDADKLAGRMFTRVAGRATKRRKIDIAPNRRARGHIANDGA